MSETNPKSSYSAKDIKVLEGLEPVRQRPGMYIGSTDVKGLHHMVYEIIDNGVDEALAGYCNNITVFMQKNGSIRVFDDGRGIPVGTHEKTGKSALEMVFTMLHAGGKFDKDVYKVSGGLHGVGASVVNALSDFLEVKVYKNGKIYYQKYERGIVQDEVKVIGETEHKGTEVIFKPDPTIFETITFNYSTIASRLKHSAYLTPGISFTIINEITGQSERFYFEGGIKTWLKNLVGEQPEVSPLLYINEKGNDILVEITLQYINTTNYSLLSFVNNIPTPDGGTHVLGFKNSMLKFINETAQSRDKIDKKIGEFQPSDITDGLYAIVTVKIPEPQFQGQTKGRLGNSFVKKEVEEILHNHLTKKLEEDEDLFDVLIEKITLTAKARVAAKLARESVLRKSAIAGGILPGKLSDCSNKSKEGTELYIVEGNSAGGSAKQGRDSSFQAILPLRGKILNTEKVVLDKLLTNNEIKSLIMAIGAGIKDSFDKEKLRYDKIIIMTDADVDGAHIRTLLLTFFFRYMKSLIDYGNLYIAVPPIYKAKQGKKEEYIYPPEDENLNETLTNLGFNLTSKVELQRYKGLGEMNPAQLWDTTMNPETRKMLKVNIDDAEDANKLFRILMGEDVGARKNFILTHAKAVKELDV